MAKAYRCDRCGKYFGEKKYDPDKHYINDTSTQYIIFTAPHESLDLCEECYTKLVQFLEDPGSDVYS